MSTAIATGFSDESLETIFKEAVQVVLQGNAIVASLNTTLVLDVSSLTDTLETSPPITVPPQTPIALAPSSPVVAPVADITFAPIPPVILPPSLNGPVLLPSPSNRSSEVPSPTPTMIRMTDAPIIPKQPVADTSRSSEDDGLDWWTWLLIGGGALAALVCGYTIVNTRQPAADTAFPGEGKRREAPVDTEDDEPRYEPPPTMNIVPSEKREVPVVAPVIIPTPVTTAAPTQAAPAFVLDDAEEDEEEEEEDEEEDEDYTLEEEEETEEDMEAGEDVHHQEGEVFEDEESYYEEEEDDGDFDEADNPNVAWGNHQQPTFGGLY